MYPPDTLIDGRYRVVRELGRGGYGVVLLCDELGVDDVLLGDTVATDGEPIVLRRVALKVLHGRPDPRRFATEIRALCRLHHPGIVTVYGWGRGDHPYVAMEFVDGQPMRPSAVATRSRDAHVPRIRQLVHVAEALAHAHARGVVHRDLKPHNILVGDDGMPRVVDFGLSWLVDPDTPATRRVGTPGYLAPELLDEGDPTEADHRADIYSLGATIYAAFAGASPFHAGGMFATVRRQLDGTFEFDDAVPASLHPLIRRCLARDPLDRPRTASAVADELRRALRAGWSEVSRTDTRRVDLRDSTLSSVEPFHHPQRGDGVRFRVVEQTAIDGEAATVEATGAFAYAGRPGSADRRAWDALSAAWPDAEVSLFDALEVTDSRGGRYLAVDGRTSVVLEPWFPVSVTDVAKIEGVRADACASRWLVDIRTAELPNRHLVIGALAHDLLERLVQYAVEADDRRTFDRLFDACAARHRISALAAGMDDGDLRSTREALAEHFGHLLEWTDPRSATRRGRVAEASRVSSRYGLEGRIDLALLDDDTLRIIELKTGRRQRPEHERQVRAYALLWDPVAEAAGRRVEGWLLYSQTGTKRPIRRREHALEREVVRPRNALVALHRWFSHGDTTARPPSYGDVMDRCRDEACRFRRDRCASQCATLGRNDGTAPDAPVPTGGPLAGADRELVVAARRYYTHFVSLIEREYRAASAAMGAVHRSSTVDDRVRARDAIAGARIEHADGAGRRVRFAGENRGVFHEGDYVIAHRGDFDAQATINGRVVDAGPAHLVIQSDGAAAAGALPDDAWVIDAAPARIGFRDMHRALFGLVASGDLRRLERIVLPARASSGQRTLLDDEATPPSFDAAGARARELNAGQRRAVAAALDDHDALLIQGPPGTGKTTVIASLVAELVAKGQRVLVAAHTNTAVDTALARIVDAGVIDVLRVGSASVASADLADALTARGRDVRRHCTADISSDADSLVTLRNRLIETPVIAATTHRCSSSAVFALLAREQHGDRDEAVWAPTFDVAIVDEASQLTEPMCLAAILRAKRFVLVGDDRQLPAVVSADDAVSATVDVTDPSLRDAGVGGLERSLFERLRPWTPCVMLTRQYRMNERVQAWPSRRYYEGRLQADPSVAHRSLDLDAASLDDLDAEMMRRLDPDRPSVWVDVGDGEVGNAHPAEAAEIARTAAALARSWPGGMDALPRDGIGVVAPFRAQCHAIRDALADALGDAAGRVEVDTVDRFQGREKEVMLVSLVRRQWCDFVMDPRRLNVTLTRARSKVIVFGARDLGRRMLDELAGEEAAAAL